MCVSLRLVRWPLEHFETITTLIKSHFVHNMIDEQKSAATGFEQAAWFGRVGYVFTREPGSFIGHGEESALGTEFGNYVNSLSRVALIAVFNGINDCFIKSY